MQGKMDGMSVGSDRGDRRDRRPRRAGRPAARRRRGRPAPDGPGRRPRAPAARRRGRRRPAATATPRACGPRSTAYTRCSWSRRPSRPTGVTLHTAAVDAAVDAGRVRGSSTCRSSAPARTRRSRSPATTGTPRSTSGAGRRRAHDPAQQPLPRRPAVLRRRRRRAARPGRHGRFGGVARDDIADVAAAVLTGRRPRRRDLRPDRSRGDHDGRGRGRADPGDRPADHLRRRDAGPGVRVAVRLRRPGLGGGRLGHVVRGDRGRRTRRASAPTSPT